MNARKFAAALRLAADALEEDEQHVPVPGKSEPRVVKPPAVSDIDRELGRKLARKAGLIP